MIPVCLVFGAHEPWRLRSYNYFDVGRRHDYFDSESTRRRLAASERLCYAPAAALLERLLERHPKFSFSLALSGPLCEQLAAHAPRVLPAFRGLVASGRVEPMSGTSHRCLPWPVSESELQVQIRLGRDRVRRDLGGEPAVFGGESPSDAAALAALLEAEGFAAMVLDRFGAASGPARRLRGAATPGRLPTLLSDDSLAEDLARRFSDGRSSEWPLTAEEFDAENRQAPGDVLCLSLNLETLGVAHPRESGIFEFFETWVALALSQPDSRFLTVSEALTEAGPQAEDLPRVESPAGTGNEMQQDALSSLVALERRARAATDPSIAEDFRRLTGADHFARMALPRPGETEPLESPYEAYIAFRHAVSDLERRLPRLPRPERSPVAGPPPA